MTLKRLIAGGVALCLMLSMAGCKDTSDSNAQPPSSSQNEETQAYNPNQIFEKIIAQIEFPEYTAVSSLDENGKTIDGWQDTFEILYQDFPGDKVESYTIGYSNVQTADEITVVVLKDKKDAEILKSEMSKRIGKRLETFENYGPEEVQKLKDAKVLSKENVVALIVCKDINEAQKGFEKAF